MTIPALINQNTMRSFWLAWSQQHRDAFMIALLRIDFFRMPAMVGKQLMRINFDARRTT